MFVWKKLANRNLSRITKLASIFNRCEQQISIANTFTMGVNSKKSRKTRGQVHLNASLHLNIGSLNWFKRNVRFEALLTEVAFKENNTSSAFNLS